MKIYIAHSREFDYINDLYKPIREDSFFSNYEIILPHENSNYHHNRDFYNDIDLLIAECSYSSIGLGIELGFAYDSKKRIYCIHQKDKKVSDSIKVITNNIIEYNSIDEMINIIKEIINNC
jgi:hypothetical protein